MEALQYWAALRPVMNRRFARHCDRPIKWATNRDARCDRHYYDDQARVIPIIHVTLGTTNSGYSGVAILPPRRPG